MATYKMYTGELGHRSPYSKRIAKMKGIYKAFIWDNRFDTRKGYVRPHGYSSRYTNIRLEFPHKPYEVYIALSEQPQFPSFINRASVKYFKRWEDAVKYATEKVRELND